MQLQKISYSNQYSSNRTQHPSAKTNAIPNFGLSLVEEEKFFSKIGQIVDNADLTRIKARFEEMKQSSHLIERFKRIFENNRALNRLFNARNVSQGKKPSRWRDINPPELIKDWDDLQVGVEFTDFGEQIHIDCMDTGRINGFATQQKDSNVANVILSAIDNALDMYAEKKFGISLADLKEKR